MFRYNINCTKKETIVEKTLDLYSPSLYFGHKSRNISCAPLF